MTPSTSFGAVSGVRASAIPGRAEGNASPSTGLWTARLYSAFPLLVVGGICVAVAVLLYLAGTVTAFGGNASIHLEPWILFLALGITGISGGVVAFFAEEDAGAEPLATPHEVPLAPTGPEWDESVIEPIARPYPSAWRRKVDEELAAGPVTEPSPPDVFLRQLDELEVSLKKKTGAPPHDESRT